MYICTFNSGHIGIGDPHWETVDYYGPDVDRLAQYVVNNAPEECEYEWRPCEDQSDGIMGFIVTTNDGWGKLEEEDHYEIAAIYEFGKLPIPGGMPIFVE